MILNSQGNQILANLSPDEYSRVIALLEEAILATDLASYFRKRDTFFKLVNDGQLDWQSNAEHRSLLRCMLMTACDVAAITKPWPVQKVVANLVMSEFYQQGTFKLPAQLHHYFGSASSTRLTTITCLHSQVILSGKSSKLSPSI